MSVPATDDHLVRQACRGDQAAFAQLVQRTSRWLYARIYADTHDPHRTEDLLQETYLTAWKSLRKLHDPAGFQAWLGQVAHTVTVDAIRHDGRVKRGGRFSRSDGDVLGRVPDATPPPDAAAAENESRAAATALLESLPAQYREVLQMRYIAGADYDTIMRTLHLTDGALRGLLNRGMALLREKLEQQRGSETMQVRG